MSEELKVTHYWGWAGTEHHPERDGLYPCETRREEGVCATSYAQDVTCPTCRSALDAVMRAAIRR